MHDYNFYMQRESIPVVKSAAELEKLRAQGAQGYLLVNERYVAEVGNDAIELATSQRSGERRWYLVPMKQQNR